MHCWSSHPACPVLLLLRPLPLFLAAGKYDLQLLCMPDAWVGCDRSVHIKLKVGGCWLLVCVGCVGAGVCWMCECWRAGR
jgi:hypothetical protein